MMNTKYKEYLVLLKLNYFYIAIIFAFSVFALWYVPKTVGQILTTNNSITSAKSQVDVIQHRLNTVNQYSTYDLGSLLSYVNQLVPEKGDSFSIHTTLDNLITRNGFTDASKSVPAEIVDANQEIVVNLGLKGGIDKLPSILTNHHYNYGRFFTIDTLSVNKKDSSITMKLTFLTSLPQTIKDPFQTLDRPSTQVLTLLEKELTNSLSPATETMPELDEYESSQSPFGITNPPTGSDVLINLDEESATTQ